VHTETYFVPKQEYSAL